MKVIFAGPSLYGTSHRHLDRVEFRPPASQGDILRAVDDGANVIGLIDGYFGWTASVWHKEILFALSLGIPVLGASSMGGSPAAECAAFGMEAIGEIAKAYVAGTLIDDDAVALTHLPEEFGYAPTTEALVDALATIADFERQGLLTPQVAVELTERAHALHFTERTVETLCAVPHRPKAAQNRLIALYSAHRRSAKAADAMLLLEAVDALPNERRPPPVLWEFAESPMWRYLRASREAGAVTPL